MLLSIVPRRRRKKRFSESGSQPPAAGNEIRDLQPVVSEGLELAVIKGEVVKDASDGADNSEHPNQLFFCMACLVKEGELDPGASTDATSQHIQFVKADGLCIYCFAVNICIFPFLKTKASLLKATSSHAPEIALHPNS